MGLAEAGHAWRQVHVGGVRRGEVRAATGCEGTAIDGVIDGAAHTAAREQGPLRVQVDRVDLGLTMHEVALLAVTRCDAARTVKASEACVLSGDNAVERVVDSACLGCGDGLVRGSDDDVDAIEPPGPIAVVVGIAQQHESRAWESARRCSRARRRGSPRARASAACRWGPRKTASGRCELAGRGQAG